MGLTVGVLSQFTKFRYPLSLIGNTMIATEIASLRDDTSLFRFFSDSEKGGRYLNSLQQTWMRGLNETIDIYGDDDFTSIDVNNQKRTYPGAINRLFESAFSVIGFQTIRDAEGRALGEYNIYKADRDARTRSVHLDLAATEAAKGGSGGLNCPR